VDTVQEKLDQLLVDCVDEFKAQFALLIDATGQVIASKGEYATDQSAAFGSLVAGDVAASHAIAYLLGDVCQLICRDCKNGRNYLIPIMEEGALFVYTTHRMTISHANEWAEQAIPVLQEAVFTYQQANPIAAPFADEEDLGDVFDDALTAVWTE